MFESLDEVGLLDQMRSAQRAERIAVARRLLAAGALCRRRMSDVGAEDRLQWCIDNWEAVAAEVGAELGVSRGRASAQMNYGVELLERLPRVAAAFAAGDLDYRVIMAVVFRTGLVTDTEVLASLDATLARQATGWNALSRRKVDELIDWQVRGLDPAAVRAARGADQDRHVDFGDPHDGMVRFWGALRATDAALLDRRLDEMAATSDPDDGRTKAQRRADALAELAAGGVPGQSGQIMIHLLTDGERAYLPGYGAVNAEALRDLAPAAAKLRPLARAAELRAEPGYRPSRALADFIRARDLCCRFPGCDKPAEVCDIDHTIPWQRGGPTHPSNLALLCRAHHLVKTFWAGRNGWRETQFSDGAIRWTSPAGRVYTTKPGGALFFPQLAEPTAELAEVLPRPDVSPGRTLMMPTRRRTRAAEKATRIAWERGLNEARMAADPPPF